jgi:hypothetical protein
MPARSFNKNIDIKKTSARGNVDWIKLYHRFAVCYNTMLNYNHISPSGLQPRSGKIFIAR